jgi:hypothetical protein
MVRYYITKPTYYLLLFGIKVQLTNVNFFLKSSSNGYTQTPSSTSSTNASAPNPPVTTTASAATSLHNSVTHKFTRDNYTLWKTTVVPILKGHSLYGFVDGTISS